MKKGAAQQERYEGQAYNYGLDTGLEADGTWKRGSDLPLTRSGN